MDSREHETDFREADRRYAELKRQLEAGSISAEEFDAQRRQLMVQDDEGRWWAKSRSTGQWHYHDGSAWVPGTPPVYQRPLTLPEESTPERQSQFEQGQPLSLSQATPPSSAPVQHQNEKKQRRGIPRWVIVAAGLLGIVALAGIGVVAVTLGRSSGPEPGYELVDNGSGQLSVEVPSEWNEHIFADSEGEKGKNWSAFLGNGETAGPSITAVNDLAAWRTGSRPHRGTYITASKQLAQGGYTDDELVSSGPNDYSSGCEAGARRDFDRPPYSGKVQEWNHCAGYSDHNVLTVSAAPQGRECVVVLQVGGFLQLDDPNIKHVLDTFETDCTKID